MRAVLPSSAISSSTTSRDSTGPPMRVRSTVKSLCFPGLTIHNRRYFSLTLSRSNATGADAENPGHFAESRAQRLFEFLRSRECLVARQQIQVFGEPRTVVKQDERRSSNQDEMLRQGGKQRDRGLLHKNKDMS